MVFHCARAATSPPAQKALGPAPEMIIMEASWDFSHSCVREGG